MDLLPETNNCGLRMRQECRERFPRHRIKRKPISSDPGMHHGTCVTHVPWRMSGSLTRGGGENVPGIPGACTTRNFTYLAKGPWLRHQMKTFCVLLGGELPAQRPVTRSFDVFLDLRLNKRLSKQSWGWWFETPSRPLWRHCISLFDIKSLPEPNGVRLGKY